VKRHEKDGKEGRDRQHDALFRDSPFCASSCCTACVASIAAGAAWWPSRKSLGATANPP
jgi:hypothetical protein